VIARFETENDPMALRLSLVCAAAFVLGPASAAEPQRPTGKEIATFGTLQSPTLEEAKAQAHAWYVKAAGAKVDQAAFDKIWAKDVTLLDKVADTLALANTDVRDALALARDTNKPAPEGLPALIADEKAPDTYLRANFALAYAKALSNRRIFEEAQAALKKIRPEQVVDPASYFFHRAVAEFSLMDRAAATAAALRVENDVPDAPDRYIAVAALMRYDMETWQENDLGWVARKMALIRDRLEINRGGEKTRKYQKEVLVRLEEMIKEKENQQKQQQQGQQGENGGSCPPGGKPQDQDGQGTNNPSKPLDDSRIAHGAGKGDVDRKAQQNTTKNWGNLPDDKQRAQAIIELTRELPKDLKDATQDYLERRQNKAK
jgi:hypothetical protein